MDKLEAIYELYVNMYKKLLYKNVSMIIQK